jgi:hypothetical protein
MHLQVACRNSMPLYTAECWILWVAYNQPTSVILRLVERAMFSSRSLCLQQRQGARHTWLTEQPWQKGANHVQVQASPHCDTLL